MIVTMDWEFLERGPELPIMPISVGMVREDGERLYLINGEAQISLIARHPFLAMNVVPYLPLTLHGDHGTDYSNVVIEWDPTHHDYEHRVGLDEMRSRVLAFLDVPELELWTYYGAFDMVCLTHLFGTMSDYPTQLPMWASDVMQYQAYLGKVPLPQQHGAVHHALHDAAWTLEAVQALKQHEQEMVDEMVSSIAGMASSPHFYVETEETPDDKEVPDS